MRVLVTGGAGFIGSAVVRHLIDAGHDVLNVDSLTYAGTLTSLRSVTGNPRYRFARFDIRDEPALSRLVGEFRPDAIIHLAAESHVDRSITGARGFVETNILGTFSVLEAARAYWGRLPATAAKAFRVVCVSTDEVYGALGPEGLFTEETRYDPSSPYAATKAAADHLASAWHRTYGLPVIISNCSNNYGPYHFPEKLIPLIILNAIQGEPLPVYGDGGQVRDWLFVDDHARALALVLDRGEVGQKYNIGGRNERTNLEVVQAICAILDEVRLAGAPHDRLIQFVADRPGHDKRYAIDPTRVETELGWRPTESFDSGIARTVAWYLDNEWWWRPLRDGVYRGERLGLIPELDTAR